MCDLCVLLRLDNQLCGEQTLGLILCGVRTVDNVGDELRSEGQRQVVAVDVARFLLVNKEEIISRFFHRYVCVFTNFDISLGAQNEESAITPCTQAIWRKPVKAYIS